MEESLQACQVIADVKRTGTIRAHRSRSVRRRLRSATGTLEVTDFCHAAKIAAGLSLGKFVLLLKKRYFKSQARVYDGASQPVVSTTVARRFRSF